MIVNRQRRVSFSAKRIEATARALQNSLHLAPESFTVALVSDQQIRALNRQFRGQSAPTDVLSFPAARRRCQGSANGYLGDVVISLETAERQARRLGHTLRAEVELLMVHGVLHLLGYDHETDHGEMNRRERKLRRRLGLA